jgi:hypothetical protein
MISEAYRAAVEMKIGIDYSEKDNVMHVWTEEENTLIECKKGTVAKAIGTILEKRHYNSQYNKRPEEFNLIPSETHRLVTFM